MSSRPHPFQKLCYIPSIATRPCVLLAAVGPKILTFDIRKGALLGQGPPFDAESSDAESEPGDFGNGSSTSKRRKLEHPGVSSLSREPSDESVEIVAERRKGERKKPKVEEPKLPNVSHIVATSDGQTVIAVTTEDKSINTFSLRSSGRLVLKSRR